EVIATGRGVHKGNCVAQASCLPVARLPILARFDCSGAHAAGMPRNLHAGCARYKTGARLRAASFLSELYFTPAPPSASARVAARHSRTVLSVLAEARMVPSGENTTDSMAA